MMSENGGGASAAVEVSIVIPSFRSRGTIGAALEAALGLETARSTEVIVVDSSDDDCGDWIESNQPGVRLVRSARRLLPGEARNLGVSRSRGEWIAFLDADATCDPKWLETLLRRLESDGRTRLAGGAIANANPDSAASRVLHYLEFSEFLPGSPSGFRPALSSSNLLLRRADFVAAGGFDSQWAMSEDLLFSLKFQSAIWFEPEAIIHHHHREEWPDVLAHLKRLGYWSGRARTAFRLKGSWLRLAPLLSFGLVPVRFSRISIRLRRTGHKVGGRDRLHLARGLWAWTRGFYRGLREETPAAKGEATESRTDEGPT